MYRNGKEIGSVFRISKSIAVVYHAGKVVWQAIRSCFGRGYWVNDVPWNNDEAWNNG